MWSYVCAVNRFYEWLLEDGRITHNPCLPVMRDYASRHSGFFDERRRPCPPMLSPIDNLQYGCALKTPVPWKVVEAYLPDDLQVTGEFLVDGKQVKELKVTLHTQAGGTDQWLVRIETHGGKPHKHVTWDDEGELRHKQLKGWPTNYSQLLDKAMQDIEGRLAGLRRTVQGMDRKQVADNALDLAAQHMRAILADPEGAPEKVTVIPITKMLGGPDGLTPARIALLIEIRSHGLYERIQDLADAMGRDKHAVSKDVDVLARHGLVHKHRKGRSVAIEADGRPIILA